MIIVAWLVGCIFMHTHPQTHAFSLYATTNITFMTQFKLSYTDISFTMYPLENDCMENRAKIMYSKMTN